MRSLERRPWCLAMWSVRLTTGCADCEYGRSKFKWRAQSWWRVRCALPLSPPAPPVCVCVCVCARWSSVGQCGYCDCERDPYKSGGSHLCWSHFLLSTDVRTTHPILNLTGYSAPCNIKFISYEETTVYGVTWIFKDVSYRRGAPYNGKCLQGKWFFYVRFRNEI